MKKSILSAFTAALVLGTAFAGTSVQALHDPLLSKNPETTPQLGTVVLVKVPNQEVKDSVHAFAQAWQHATTRIAEVKAKQAEGKELTKNEKNGSNPIESIITATISVRIFIRMSTVLNS